MGTKKRGFLMKIIGERIRILREREGISQKALSQKLNIPLSTYNTWERGMSTPKPEKILELVEIFNTNLDYLYGRSDDSYESLDEYKLQQLANRKILKMFGIPPEKINALDKESFDEIMKFADKVIKLNEYEEKNKKDVND